MNQRWVDGLELVQVLVSHNEFRRGDRVLIPASRADRMVGAGLAVRLDRASAPPPRRVR